MPPKKIIELQQKTLQRILKATNNFKNLIFEDTWENICSEFGESSTIFNSLQQEWVELQNEDGDKLSAFDTESLDPSTDVKLLVNVGALQEAEERLLPLNLHSAVYTFSCFAEGHAGHDIELSELARKKENKALRRRS